MGDFMKQYIFLLIFILFALNISAVDSGTDYLIYNSTCNDFILIRYEAEKPFGFNDDFYFVGCEQGNLNDTVKCLCKNVLNGTYIHSAKDFNNKFSFVIEYYIAPYINYTNNSLNDSKIDILNDNSRRYQRINELIFAEKIEPLNLSFLDNDYSFWGIVAVLCSVIIILVIYSFYYFFIKDHDEKEPKKSKSVKIPSNLNKNDADLLDYIKKL